MNEHDAIIRDQMDDLRDLVIGGQISIHEAVKRFANLTGDYAQARNEVRMIFECEGDKYQS